MVTRTNFGLFTQAGNGLGSANAQNQDATVTKLANPALPGQYVTLWGTGLGLATSDEVRIQLGGTEIAPVYAGPAPALTGVDQIDFRVPDTGTLDGCYVSVVVKTGDIASNEATIAKASRPGPCDHPFGLSAADMATLDSGRQILFGVVHLQSDAPPPPGLVPELGTSPAAVQFLPRNAFDIGLLAQPLTGDDSYFVCRPSPQLLIGGAFVFLGGIDAGASLTLAGPGRTAALSGNGPIYDMSGDPLGTPPSDPPFLVPGTWRIEGPGGKTIGPFQADLVLPPTVRWTNRDNLAAIDRGQDQDVTWDPSGYTDTDVAAVSLGQIFCRAPATAGKLTIPSTLLETLPLGSASLRLGIAPRPNRRKLFSLPLTNGSSAQAFFDYSFSETISSQLSQ
jgi:hypothetical protein